MASKNDRTEVTSLQKREREKISLHVGGDLKY